jgi:hypothetical protein
LAGNLLQPFPVKGMERLPPFQQHVVGDIDNVVDGASTCGLKSLL